MTGLLLLIGLFSTTLTAAAFADAPFTETSFAGKFFIGGSSTPVEITAVEATETLDDSSASLSFSPQQPTVADQVVLAVGGLWQNGCTPQISQVQIFAADHVVRVDAVSNLEDNPCSQSVTPYGLSVTLQFDLAGTYQVVYYVQDGPNGNPVLTGQAVLDVGTGLRISPPVVTVDLPVTILVSDIAPTICIPTFDSYSVDEQTIVLDFLSSQGDQPCATSATPWAHSLILTDLAPGVYAVQVRITQVEDGLRMGSRIAHQLPLMVMEELHQYFLPVISNP